MRTCLYVRLTFHLHWNERSWVVHQISDKFYFCLRVNPYDPHLLMVTPCIIDKPPYMFHLTIEWHLICIWKTAKAWDFKECIYKCRWNTITSYYFWNLCKALEHWKAQVASVWPPLSCWVSSSSSSDGGRLRSKNPTLKHTVMHTWIEIYMVSMVCWCPKCLWWDTPKSHIALCCSRQKKYLPEDDVQYSQQKQSSNDWHHNPPHRHLLVSIWPSPHYICMRLGRYYRP